MYGKGFISMWLITLGIQGLLSAQEPLSSPIRDEDFLYRDESMAIPHEIYERFTDLIANPLNLNTASADQLDESGLFTPFQVHNLIRYRHSYGNLYSVYELMALPGFRKSKLMKIAPCLTVETGKSVNPKRKNQHMIMLNAGKTLPVANGYRKSSEDGSEPAYGGSPLRTSLRIKSSIGRNFSLGLTYEKDAGEQFYVGNKPEFLSGYIQYKGHRLIKQLVLGNFQINHGLGLVNGAGFIHSPGNFRVNRQSMFLIRPYSSKSESGHERGAAIKMDLKLMSLLCWASYRSLDLSLASVGKGSGQIDWKEHLRNTGLHRTGTEMEGRKLAYRLHGGLQGLFSYRQLHAGMAFSTESTGLTRSGIRATGIQNDPGINKYLSLHGSWLMKHWQFFGEMALSDQKSLAVLTGVRWEANDFFQGLVLLHHYGREYRGSQPSAYASGSIINNERGLALHVRLEPGKLINADFSGELFHYPGPRYLTLVPSYGQRYSVTFRNSGLPVFQWRIKMVSKIWQCTPEDHATGLRPLRNKQVSRFDTRIIYDHVLQWQSRLLVSFLARSIHTRPAYAAVQQLRFHSLKWLKFTLQFVVFDVKDWDNRIYLYEPGLYYSFNFPSLYGSGQKSTLVLTLKAFHKLSIAAKVACTVYQHRKTLGTGNDLIQGNTKWSLDMQLRLNL